MPYAIEAPEDCAVADQFEQQIIEPLDADSRRRIAERFAPVLVLWPEIPAMGNAPESLRDEFARQRQRSASHATTGAHIQRDFHPRDVRLILDHSQSWEPRAPLPLVPIGFIRLYRDFARFFFLPMVGVVVVAMLMLALALSLETTARTSVEIGALVLLGAVYLVTLRSPILTPVDFWHHLNHAVSGAGLVGAWLLTFGDGDLWYLGLPVIGLSLVLPIASLAIGVSESLAVSLIWPIRMLRGLTLWVLNRRTHSRPHLRESSVFRGLKPPHEYTDEAELFFRHPRGGKPMHRSDRNAFWAAYSRILAHQEDQYPLTCYARVLDPNAQGLRAVQYWYSYYYDDWANEHESDWEMVLVMLRGMTPVAVAATSHEGGEIRDWEHVESRGDRPVLYVAAGSHAFVFQQGASIAEREVAGLRFTSADAKLLGKEVLDFVDFTLPPDEGVLADDLVVALIPDPEPASGLWGHVHEDSDCKGNCAHNFEWLNYYGHWGSVGVSLTGGYTGPRGPAASGLIWDNPYLWADTACRTCAVCSGEREPSTVIRPKG